MRTDDKQFNGTALSYEEVERQISQARALRSAAVARAIARLSVTLSAGSRRLLGGVPVPATVAHRAGRAARCK